MQWAQTGSIKTKSQLDEESALATGSRSSIGVNCVISGKQSNQTGSRDSVAVSNWPGSLDIKTQPSSTSDQIPVPRTASHIQQKPQPYLYKADEKLGIQNSNKPQNE